jgi:hypothetical protein
LLEQDGFYRQLYDLQFQTEALDAAPSMGETLTSAPEAGIARRTR